MKKKIFLTFVICFFLIKKKKKGDPEYKETEKNIFFKDVFTIVI